MSLKNISDNPDGNKDNIEALQAQKQDKIIRSDRAPTSSDNGTMWIKQTAGGATLILYIRDTISGAWRSATFS